MPFPFFGGREEKMQMEAEKRAMNFQREQNLITINTPQQQQDMTELQINEGRSDLIKWQQQLDDELQEIVFTLKGFRKKDGVWFIPTNPTALCNDLFIDEVVIPQCRPFLSRNLINSNFQEERILMMLRTTMDDITDNMADHYDKYDIDFTNYDLILRLIKNVIKPGIFRSLNGWTKKTDSTNFKRIEISNETQEQKQKGLFGF